MKKKVYCLTCDEIRNCELKEEKVTKSIDCNVITYKEKKYICPICGEAGYDAETFDENVHDANDELRKITGLIRKCEIEEILSKYSVSQKNLSKILGFGEIQISRYLKSGNPSREHSDKLKSIKDNPFVYEGYVLDAKNSIDEKVFKKQIGKIRQLELTSEHSKIYNIGLYLIESLGDITNLSLQKILYFLNGFSPLLLGHNLFSDTAQAWPHGPVYAKMYDAFSYYVRDNINISEVLKDREFDLTNEEKEYIDEVSKYFSCYGGSKLRNMSHQTEPWINARLGLEENEPSNRIIDEKDITGYFKEMVKKYNIKSYEDIGKYAIDLFNKVQ